MVYMVYIYGVKQAPSKLEYGGGGFGLYTLVSAITVWTGAKNSL